MANNAITERDKDFAQWYTDIIRAAKLCDYSSVKGCIVIEPNGYAICPDEFYDIFYSTTPAGFVNITVDNDIVASMEVNQTALNEYIASHKDTEPTEQEPTADEILNTLLGVA